MASKNEADDQVFSVLKSLGEAANIRKLFPALLKKLTQEEIILALNRLERSGEIRIGQKGNIEILKKVTTKEKHSNKTEPGIQKYFYGTADVTKSGAAFVTVDELDRDVFIPNRYVRNTMQGDEVKIRITSFSRRPEGEIVAIIKRSQESFTGRVEVLDKFAFFIADEKKLGTDVFVPPDALNGAKSDERVIVRITDWNTSPRKPIGEVVEILSDQHSSDLDMKMILITNGFSIDFPRSVYEELARVPEKIPAEEIKRRLDMREVTTFTIDPEDAKDFDDAISVRTLPNGNFEIGVHIADVSHYVPEGSQLDKEAERRATSVYLPDRVCPMLPEKLSNVLCSLRPHEDKLTFSTIFEFDKNFDIKDFTIARTVIHSNRRFTYEQAQEVLESGQGEYVSELQLLQKISKHLRMSRMKQGAIAFEKSEVKFKLDEKGKPIGIVLKVRKDAHLLVEDFMLLANETVAKFGTKIHNNKKTYPFVYRIHDKPDLQKLESFSAIASRFGYKISFDKPEDASSIFNSLLKKVEGKPEQDVLETMAIRSMAKAEYSTKNIGHYGLAMKNYTHFTSPIRRYPDILVHRLSAQLMNEPDKLVDKDELEGRCKNSSLMERKAMDAEREAVKYKQIEFLQDKIGEEYEGIISGVVMRGVFVEMTENKCEGMVSVESLGNEDFAFDEKMVRLTGVRSKRRFELGDKIKVKILSADIILRRIDLGLVSIG